MVLPFRPQASPGAFRVYVNRLIPAFKVQLTNRRYSLGIASKLTGTARHMMTWPEFSGTDVTALEIRGVEDFPGHDCDVPAAFRTPNELSKGQAHRVRGYLIETGQGTIPSAIATGGGVVDSFTETLTGQAYSESTIRKHRSCCRHCMAWLYLAAMAPMRIDGASLRRFLDQDCT